MQEKIDLVGEKLAQFADMPGFPKAFGAIEGCAKAYAAFVSLENLDWLCDQIWARCQFFPRPIQARTIYTSRYRPEDGQNPEDLTKDLED